MRVGIFGGTFDPPHNGHKKYACEFIDRLALDKLLVIPTCIPPHKEHRGASGEDRLAMTKLAFADCEKVTVSDMELKRQGKSYTADTVRELDEQNPDDEFIFLMGSDMLLCFHKWWNTQEILRHVKICAVSRGDGATADMMRSYVDEHFSQDRDRFIICDFEPVTISSTAVRDSIKNKDVENIYLDKKVMDYIKEKELYL